MILSLEQYKALARMSSNNSHDWGHLKQALTSTIEAERIQLEEANTIETMYRLQGRIGMLKELLHAIENSRDVVQHHAK